jgi:hypothetical protein
MTKVTIQQAFVCYVVRPDRHGRGKVRQSGRVLPAGLDHLYG